MMYFLKVPKQSIQSIYNKNAVCAYSAYNSSAPPFHIFQPCFLNEAQPIRTVVIYISVLKTQQQVFFYGWFWCINTCKWTRAEEIKYKQKVEHGPLYFIA